VVIADASYRTIATVRAGHGLAADLHEIVISPQDTALITAYKPVTANLSGWAAPARGVVLSGVVPEIDIPSGRVLSEWSSIDHARSRHRSRRSPGTSKVPFRLLPHQLDLDRAGRHPADLRGIQRGLQIARPAGRWSGGSGGRRSSLPDGAGHDVLVPASRPPPGPDTLSISTTVAPRRRSRSPGHRGPPEHEHHAGHAAAQLYSPTRRLLAAFEGSKQVLPSGRVLIGWATCRTSRVHRERTLILDGQYPAGDHTYRILSAAGRASRRISPPARRG